jgi:hypothetical protein
MARSNVLPPLDSTCFEQTDSLIAMNRIWCVNAKRLIQRGPRVALAPEAKFNSLANDLLVL